MFPVICQIGAFKIYYYYAAIIISDVVCITLFFLDAKRTGLPSQKILSVIFWPFAAGTLGLRLSYVFSNWKYFGQHLNEIGRISDGGLLWYGAFVFVFVTGFVIARIERLSFWKLADLVAPYLALNQAIARFGCYLNGCCFGKEMIWGVYVPLYGKILLPRQLYLIAGHLIIFCLLKKVQPKGKFSGQIFILFLVFDTLLKFAVDSFSR